MIVLSLFVLVRAFAQPKLSPADEREIRALIDEQSKKQERHDREAARPWSERGPFVYHMRELTALVTDVAMADCDGATTGTFPQLSKHIFILTRVDGKWSIARHIVTCPNGAPVMLQPLAGGPLRAVHGSSDCPN